MTSKERCNLYIIYACIAHRWIVNRWIVYRELAQTYKNNHLYHVSKEDVKWLSYLDVEC